MATPLRRGKPSGRGTAATSDPDQREAAAAGSGPLSSTGQRLLQIARRVSRTDLNEDTSEQLSPLSEFVQIYREWIATNRGRLGTQQQQAEQWQLIMHAMVTAPHIEDAIHQLIRFGKVVWGERGPSALRIDGDQAILIFAEPFHAGPEGLIAEIWPLALTLCELEFLANARFSGASGRVANIACLPDGVVPLLFAPPIAFHSAEVALLFPRRHLRRPVVARPTDLPLFFAQLLPLTLGARQDPPSIRSLTAALVRDDKVGPEFREPSLVNVAARLGMSAATLRRRLRDEGVSYRLVKEDVYNALARDWLGSSQMTVGEVASRLDFSDSFAFRRFFRRLNGIPPSAARTSAGAPAVPHSGEQRQKPMNRAC